VLRPISTASAALIGSESISAALAVLIGRSPKGDTSQRFQTLWPRGRRMPTSWSCCVWSNATRVARLAPRDRA